MRNHTPLEVAPNRRHLWVVGSPAEKPAAVVEPAAEPKKKPRKPKAKKRPPPATEVSDLSDRLKTAFKDYKKRHELSTDLELAAHIKMSNSQISNWTAKHPKKLGGITWWTLKQLAEKLDVPTDWLLFAPADSPVRRASEGYKR